MRKLSVFFSLLCSLCFVSSSFAQTSIYILGDATPVGWDIANPDPLTFDSTNSVYIWEGTLVPGEFKFPLFTGDWCDSTWINATQTNAALSSTGFIYTNGCDGPDNKWLVGTSEAGQYRIEIYLDQDSISISAATNTTDVNSIDFKVYPNPVSESFTIDLGGQATADIRVYNQIGQEVHRVLGYENRDLINVQNLNLSGVYSIHVETEVGRGTRRIVFLK